jgi:hypothetical protein
MNNTPLADIVEKVKKCLRLAEHGTEHEKKVAMEKAASIAQNYRIDMTLLNLEDESTPDQNVAREDVNLGKKIDVRFKHIARILKSHFNVGGIYTGDRYSGRQIVFVGFEHDVDMAKYLLEMLTEEFSRLWVSHKKYTGDITRNKASYFYGLYLGLNETLSINHKTAVEEKLQTVGSDRRESVHHNYQLAIVDQKEKVDAAVRSHFPRLVSSSVKMNNIRNYSTVEAGRIAGRSISVNRPLTYGQSNRLATV